MPDEFPWRIAGAAFGALIVALLLGSLWWTGAFSPRSQDAGLSARLERLEAQIAALSARPVPVADTTAMNNVASRLAKIEAALATPQAPAAKADAEEIAALRGRLDELAALARNAQSRAESAAASADAAQKSSQTATAEAARAAQADDKASRRAVAANALRAAVERSEVFVAELAAARSLAGDSKILAPLEPFAAQGIPSASAMTRDLAAIVPAMLRLNSATTPDAGILDKLQANAERLVRVRPVGDAAGDDTSSIIARVENRAAQNDIDGALSELMKLPATIRAPAENWIKTAEQRKAAIGASRQFARDALAALGNPAL
jgi:hypothetical protein